MIKYETLCCFSCVDEVAWKRKAPPRYYYEILVRTLEVLYAGSL